MLNITRKESLWLPLDINPEGIYIISKLRSSYIESAQADISSSRSEHIENTSQDL